MDKSIRHCEFLFHIKVRCRVMPRHQGAVDGIPHSPETMSDGEAVPNGLGIYFSPCIFVNSTAKKLGDRGWGDRLARAWSALLPESSHRSEPPNTILLVAIAD